jgi:8-oxo-dGTP diphosphatase
VTAPSSKEGHVIAEIDLWGKKVKIQQVFSQYHHDEALPSTDTLHCLLCGAVLQPSDQSASQRKRCPECRWTYYANPLPGVVIFIEDEQRVLLGRRASGSYRAGTWCLPGGFIEYHEDFLSAAIREAREETGLTVEIESILSVVSNFLAPRLHTLVVVLKGKPIAGSPAPGDDIAELKWFRMPGPLPEMAFHADRHIIERVWETRLTGIPTDQDYSHPMR